MREIKSFMCNALLALTACGLAACGGGGESASNNSWLSFTPSSINVTSYPGESQSVTIRAKSSKTIAEKINIGIIDTKGVFTTNTSIGAISATEYVATLHT